MDSQRWDEVEVILDKALELQENARATYVKFACEGDTELEKEIFALLDAIQNSEDEHFLENGSKDNCTLIQNIATERIADNFIGKRIGVFELTEQIGSGGMSLVFKAERADGQFNQQVAVKLIRSGLHSEEILQRFELEKQILAGLSHPHIARLYDGGITADGNPYLIMEYIDGKPIDKYCDACQLTVDERLHLFKDVCSAVEHAHNNLIVHRDLKAQNIYVTETGIVKVLDFGIAKLLDTKLSTGELLTTQAGRQFWTPQYASPEQMNDEAATTASDVYSLGVLLHKLLTGAYPFDFTNKSITQICTAVANQPPDSLLKSLNKDAGVERLADNRNSDLSDLKKELKGDLEAIKAKTLRKKASDRYSSVNKLAEDVSNYQSNMPVEARKGNTVYKSKKFVRRHKSGIGVAALILIIIISLVTFYTNQLSQQKQDALYAAEKATTVSALIKDILRKSSPYGRYGEEISLAQVLANGTKQIETELKNQPLLKVEMLGLLSEIYTNLGRYEKAKPLLKKALQIQANSKEKEPEQKALNLQRFGYLLFRQGNFEQSIVNYKKAQDIILNTNQTDSILLYSLYNQMGMAYAEMAQRQKALSFYENALKLVPESDWSAKATVLGNTGILYQNLDRFDKAILLLRKDLTLRKKFSASSTPNLASAYNNLAFAYQRSGNMQKADSLHRIALKMRKNILPPDHPHIASSLVRYGLVKVKLGDVPEAEKMFERAHQILKLRLPDNHWQILSAEGALALARGLQGQLSTGIPILQKIYQKWKNQFGEDDWRTHEAHQALQALLYAKQKTRL